MHMRIAVFTSQFPGRVNTFFMRDMRSLLESGMEVHVFAIYPLSFKYWKLVPDVFSEDLFARFYVHHIGIRQSLLGCPIKSFRDLREFFGDLFSIFSSAISFGHMPVIKSLYAVVKGWGWAHATRRERFDHVLAYWGNYAATSAYIFHRLRNEKAPFSTFLHAGTDLYRDQVFLKQKLVYAKHVIVVCDFNRSFIRNLYPIDYQRIADKIHLHHLGLDFSEFPFAPANRPDNCIVGVGSLTKNKGFDYLLHAAHALLEKGIKVNVILVGDGEERQVLQGLARKLDIAEYVSFLGWQSFDSVKEIMLGATVLVHPSSGLGDAVPTVIKEALALGTPVVASNVAGIPELLDDGCCGILVPPQDIQSLADGIKKIIEDKKLRLAYAQAGRLHAERKFDRLKNGQILSDMLKTSSGYNEDS